MDETIPSLDVSHLSDEMANAARNFASLKFNIDMLGRRRPDDIPDDLHGSMTWGDYGPHFASSFFLAIIPFFPVNPMSRHETICAVPVAHTLGCSKSWWPDRITAEDEVDIREHISSEHGIAATGYTWIPELGLCLPGEGKNRINFCRYHGIEFIKACVSVRHYPAAERIEIIELSTLAGIDVWAILDNRYVQKVSHYDYALPLLRAYGVKITKIWPTEMPPTQIILQHARKCMDSSPFSREVIDTKVVQMLLDKRAQKEAEEETLTRCSLLHLPIRRRFLYCFAVLFVWMVGLAVWGSFREGITGEIGLATVAFCSGILAVMMAPVLQIKQKHIAKS